MVQSLRFAAMLLALLLGTLGSREASSGSLGPLVVGGFDLRRGGIESLANPIQAELRNAIQNLYPGTKFVFSGKLSKQFFSHVNVVVLGVFYGGSTFVTPLTLMEQANLREFVLGGGTALIFADGAGPVVSKVNDSFLDQFDIISKHTAPGSRCTVLLPGYNPVASGPAGNIQRFQSFYSGWFTSIGASVELGRMCGNDQPTIAYIQAGTLAPGSGAAVFFADSNSLLLYGRTRNDEIGILNALALAAGGAGGAGGAGP